MSRSYPTPNPKAYNTQLLQNLKYPVIDDNKFTRSVETGLYSQQPYHTHLTLHGNLRGQDLRFRA